MSCFNHIMITTNIQGKVITVKIHTTNTNGVRLLAENIKEQAEILMNRKKLQQKLNKVSKEESVEFPFVRR